MQIVHGNPTPEEVAALVVVLALLQRAASDTLPGHASSRWETPSWRRPVTPVGRSGHWRDWSAGWRDVTPLNGRPVARSDRPWTRLVG